VIAASTAGAAQQVSTLGVERVEIVEVDQMERIHMREDRSGASTMASATARFNLTTGVPWMRCNS
jgi:hypothetical protein